MMDFQVYTAGEVKIWVQELGPGARWSSVNRGPLGAMQNLAQGVAPYSALLRDILAKDMVAGARVPTHLHDLYDSNDAFRRDLIAELNQRNALPLRSLPRQGTEDGIEENAMAEGIAAATGATSTPAPTQASDAGEGTTNALRQPTTNTEQSDEDRRLRWAALLDAADSLQSSEDGLAGPSRGSRGHCPISIKEQ